MGEEFKLKQTLDCRSGCGDGDGGGGGSDGGGGLQALSLQILFQAVE